METHGYWITSVQLCPYVYMWIEEETELLPENKFWLKYLIKTHGNAKCFGHPPSPKCSLAGHFTQIMLLEDFKSYDLWAKHCCWTLSTLPTFLKCCFSFVKSCNETKLLSSYCTGRYNLPTLADEFRSHNPNISIQEIIVPFPLDQEGFLMRIPLDVSTSPIMSACASYCTGTFWLFLLVQVSPFTHVPAILESPTYPVPSGL